MTEGRKEETRRDRGRHPVDEVSPAGRLAVYGFQHVLAMYAVFGITDFNGVAETTWLGVTTPFYFGLPTFHLFPII